MGPDLDGYTKVGSYPVDEFCDYLFDEDSPLNRNLPGDIPEDNEFTAVGCSLLALTTPWTPTIGAIGVACDMAVVGCAVDDILEQLPCNGAEISAYVHTGDGPSSFDEGFILIECRDSFDVEETASMAADELEDLADQAYGFTVETGDDIQSYVCEALFRR